MADASRTTAAPPRAPQAGCHFCDGTGVTNQRSYDQAVADGCERIAWKPGTRCLCTYTWDEIAPAVADICTEIANGQDDMGKDGRSVCLPVRQPQTTRPQPAGAYISQYDCPCKDEQPDPCPMCGATVSGNDAVNGVCQIMYFVERPVGDWITRAAPNGGTDTVNKTTLRAAWIGVLLLNLMLLLWLLPQLLERLANAG